MRSINFGEGTAATSIPNEWIVKRTPKGTIVVAPPDQNIAFLWLSTVSWQMPNAPDFSPSGYALQRQGAGAGIRTEEHPEFVILYSLEESTEKGQKLDTHQFEIAPRRAQGGKCMLAFLTLSVKQEERESTFVAQVIGAVWVAARKVTFNYDG